MGYNIQFVFDEAPSPNWAQLRAQLEGLAGDYRLVDDPDVPAQPEAPTQLRAGEIRADEDVIGYATFESNIDPNSHTDIQALPEELDTLEEDDESVDTEHASARL